MKIVDEQLVKKCLEKDVLAQKQLFDRYVKKMMGVCARYFRNSDDAQDVLQMGFVKVFEKLASYQNKGSLESWIRRIMVNTALDTIRKNKKLGENITIDAVDYQLKNIETSVLDNLNARDLLEIIQKMPVGFRTVFNLYAIEGYSHKEIADELGISVNTSKSQYSRARGYLQKIILEEKIVLE